MTTPTDRRRQVLPPPSRAPLRLASKATESDALGANFGSHDPCPVALRSACGVTIPLPVDRWRAPATPVEHTLLADLPHPVLDVGCGPGRLVVAAVTQGRTALGIDVSPWAVAEASARGAPVLRRNVFESLPGEGRWGAALLVDGNIGIGGDPVRLLGRIGNLLAPGGVALVEVEPPGSPGQSLLVRLHVHALAGRRAPGPCFPWARVGADDIAALAMAAGLVLAGLRACDGRWFAWLRRP